MKFLIDYADPKIIENIAEYYPIDGVTTNPSILAKTGRNPYEVLKEIRSVIGQNADFHVQVISSNADEMVKEAYEITKHLGQETFIKVPSVKEGFKAMKAMVSEGFNVTATCIYTPLQAFIAGKCGTLWAAPYVNRIDNMGFNGVQITKDIHDIFKVNGLKTQVLAASFKNSYQVLELCKYGVGASTVAPDVIYSIVKNREIEGAVEDFKTDFEKLSGEHKTMLNV